MKPTTSLGHSPLNIKRIGLGCMGMSEFYGSFDEKESIHTLHKAVDNEDITTIPGTRKVHRLEENMAALDVVLTQDDLDLLQKSTPSETVGARY